MDWLSRILDLISTNEATLSGLAAVFGIVGVTSAVGYRIAGLVRRNPVHVDSTSSSFTSEPVNARTSHVQSRADVSATEKPSVAVLPFRNISNDDDKDYFADGMTEDIITGLSRTGHLSVKSRSATFGLRDQLTDLRALGADLKVGYLVDGSVRPVARNVRISVQLVATSTGNSLWAEKFDRPAEELFEIQDEVIAGITSALGAVITKAESARASALTPQTLSAWEAVQRASFYRGADGNSEDETNKSIEELRAAVASEPEYAYAHSMLAWILNYRALNALTDDPASDYRESKPHLQKGLALAGDDAFNLNLCAGALGYAFEFERAEALCHRALEIDPNFADAYFNLAQIYTFTGRFEDAHAALDRVVAMAPDGPMWRYYDWYRASAFLWAKRFAEAEPLIRATIERSPSYTAPYIHLATVLARQNRPQEATDVLRRLTEVNPRFGLERVRLMYAKRPKIAEQLAAVWPDA